MRDAGSEVLPLSQVGGYVLGARAVAFAGVPGTAAAASTIVDVSLEFVSQIAFTGLALVWLTQLKPDAPVTVPVAIGLVAAGILAAGLLAAQRRGFNLIDRLAGALGRDWLDRTAAGAAALHAAISAIYERRVRLCANFVLHLVCWIAATLEAWLALRFAGAPLGFGVVLVIEGLLYAIRSVAFAVPNAVGVQEGAYIMLGGSFGLTPEMALALSLLKRARDLGARTAGARRVPASRRRPSVAPRRGARIEVTGVPADSASSSLALRRGKSSRLGLVLALLALLAQIAGAGLHSPALIGSANGAGKLAVAFGAHALCSGFG